MASVLKWRCQCGPDSVVRHLMREDAVQCMRCGTKVGAHEARQMEKQMLGNFSSQLQNAFGMDYEQFRQDWMMRQQQQSFLEAMRQQNYQGANEAPAKSPAQPKESELLVLLTGD